MSKTLIENIIDSPENILQSFKTHDISFLKNELFITGQKILSKFGKYDVDENGMPSKNLKDVFDSMPQSTKQMFWSINNASALIESLLNYNEEMESEIKRMRGELSVQQIEIIKLQKQLNK